MDSLATSTAQRWAHCSLICLCLFSAGLLLGSRPFFFPALLPPPWEHFSRLQQPALRPPSRPPPPHHHAAAAYHDHDDSMAPAPEAGPGDLGSEEEVEQEVETAVLEPAPAPASIWEDGGDEEGRECDVFDGSWVRDPARYPLYVAAECPFLSDQVTCRRNSRLNAGYEEWRWQPRGCGGAGRRLDGSGALEQCRNRRLVLT